MSALSDFCQHSEGAEALIRSWEGRLLRLLLDVEHQAGTFDPDSVTLQHVADRLAQLTPESFDLASSWVVGDLGQTYAFTVALARVLDRIASVHGL